ncbi:MAG: NAD(P)H-hydrate dehydratase [Roseobacter sp.]
MQKHEKETMQSGQADGLDLMERAGRGVVSSLLSVWPQMAAMPARAIVLCGPGNNGGDGYVIARLLRARGWNVRVFAWGDISKLPEDAHENARRWLEIGDIELWCEDSIAAVAPPQLVVDAVFGIGLRRPPPAEVAAVLRFYSAPPWPRPAKWLAVDCPSALDLDTGRILSAREAARADLTVTFHCPKPGHLLNDGPAACGDLRIVDIGLPRVSSASMVLVEASRGAAFGSDIFEGIPLPTPAQGHKYDRGHAMVLAGGVGRGGAGRLAARAALRAGAGLVTMLCPPAALQENASALEAIMLRRLDGPEDLAERVDDRIRTLCLGPGLGLSGKTAKVVRAALALRRTTVLDADALTVFAQAPSDLFQLLHPNCVLTPHEGEFARLFPDLAAELRAGACRIDCVAKAAARAGAVVLLKGPTTVISAPSGPAYVHVAHYDRQAPWLATAGAGDVLAGLITGLATLAPDIPLDRVTAAAVWLHVEAARVIGPGLIAEELSDAVPTVLRRLLQ